MKNAENSEYYTNNKILVLTKDEPIGYLIMKVFQPTQTTTETFFNTDDFFNKLQSIGDEIKDSICGILIANDKIPNSKSENGLDYIQIITKIREKSAQVPIGLTSASSFIDLNFCEQSNVKFFEKPSPLNHFTNYFLNTEILNILN